MKKVYIRAFLVFITALFASLSAVQNVFADKNHIKLLAVSDASEGILEGSIADLYL